MDQSKLSPTEQKSLFALLQKAGQQPTSGGDFISSTDGGATSPDLQAQQGLGNVDNSGLRSLFGGQDGGDAIHPAVHQIAASMGLGPQAPEGVGLATGPKMAMNNNGQLEASIPSDNPLLKFLGMQQHIPVNESNYYSAAKNAGLLKYLPSGQLQMPDGTPFIGKTAFGNALDAQKVLVGQGKEVYTTLDQLTSQGLDPESARALLAANPQGATSKEVANYMGNQRLQDTHTIAQARATMAGVAKLGQALKVGGFDAAQPMAEAANKNLGAVQRVQAAIDQVMANGGQANEIQRSEIAAGLGILAANGSSQLTDERMNKFLPDTIMNKYGNFKEFLTNARGPVDFTGFLPQFQDLLTREKQANQGLSNAASQLGVNIMGQSQPQTATGIANARNASPIVGQSPASSVMTPPVTRPPVVNKIRTASDYLNKFNGR